MKTACRAAVVAAALISATVFAQALQTGEDENALVDALTLPALTRSMTSDPKAASHAGRASLLIEFETNSSTLTETARKQLEVVGRALNTAKLTPFSFNVEGHADPRGSPDRNLRLSQARAESVREYLMRTQNVAAERLKAMGKGDREPLNRSNPAAPENRRVTFVTLRP